MFTCTFKTSGAAFHSDDELTDTYTKNEEIARILREIAAKVSDYAYDKEMKFAVMDINGNKIGEFKTID